MPPAIANLVSLLLFLGGAFALVKLIVILKGDLSPEAKFDKALKWLSGLVLFGFAWIALAIFFGA